MTNSNSAEGRPTVALPEGSFDTLPRCPKGTVAWLECRHHALHPAGDHMLFIGEVESCAFRAAPSSLWHGGKYFRAAPWP